MHDDESPENPAPRQPADSPQSPGGCEPLPSAEVTPDMPRAATVDVTSNPHPTRTSTTDQRAPVVSVTTLCTNALRRVWHQRRLVVGLWLLNLGITLVAGLPTLLQLAAGLALRPAATSLARGQVDALWGELLDGRHGVREAALSWLALALFLHWVVGVSLSGGLLPALLRPGHPARVAPGRVLAHAATHAAAMWRMEAAGLLLLRLPLLVLLAAAATALGHSGRPQAGTFSLLLAYYAPLLAVGLVAWAGTSWLLNVARLFLVTRGAGPTAAVRTLRQAARFLLQSRAVVGPTLAMALIGVLTYAAWIAVGRVAAAPFDAGLYVGCALVVRQVSALGRSALGLTQLAAVAEQWHTQGPSTT